MVNSSINSRSISADYLKNSRYLPDGTLNIAARWKSPGPGKYLMPSCTGYLNHDFTIEKRPAYTIAKRYKDKSLETISPGPIYFPLTDVTSRGRVKSAAFHMAGRHKENETQSGPGPSDYYPEKIKHSSPAYTISGKHKNLDKDINPVAPNQYFLSSTIGNNNYAANIKTAPKYSISSRNKFMSITYGMDDTPTSLYSPNVEFIKTKSPKWTITGRNYLPEIDSNIPGPNQYKTENVRINSKSSPSITMGIRHSEFCSTGFPISEASD